MAIIQKRRFVTQLPVIHQTGTLKNFFAATIDNLFQPGASEAISGYVGQKPSYFDAAKDFYVEETTAGRAAYQLEPAMVSLAADGTFSNSLCYDDLINYLRSQGAEVSNHSRLFDGDYYSWSPPVDLDKLNNPRQYVWMGGLTSEEDRRTAMVLRAPRLATGYAGTNTFPLPPVNPAYQGKYEAPVVLVNGKAERATFTSSDITVTTNLTNGDRIETIRYGDLTKILVGQKDMDLSYFLSWKQETSGFDSNGVYQTNLPRRYLVGDVVYARIDVTQPFKAWRCVTEHQTEASFNADKWTTILGAEIASSGLSVRLEDGEGAIAQHAAPWVGNVAYEKGDLARHEGVLYWSIADHTSEATFNDSQWKAVGTVARRFFMDGVGSSIDLTPDFTTNSGGRVAHHVVIDRRSNEDSPWTRRNMWVHKSTLEWTGMLFQNRQAARPIIEFLPNIELFAYGTRRIMDVTATLSTEKARVRDNYDLYPYDVLPWEEEDVIVSRINGQPIGYLSFYKKNADGTYVIGANGKPVKERREPFGCVEVDAYKPTIIWTANTAVTTGSRIIVGNSFYEAIADHISSDDFATDFRNDLWVRSDGHLIKPGDRLLVRQSSSTEPELNNLIYRVVANNDVQYDNGAEADVLELIAEAPPERGDIVRVIRNGDTSVFADNDEYYFNGESWLLAQSAESAPLFMLYDADQNRLNDESIYIGTDFAGSRLFGFKLGTGPADSVLGFPLSYNQYAQPIFEVDPITRRTTFEGGTVSGYYYHHFLGQNGEEDSFSNNWFAVEEPSVQKLVNGVYEIPLNLQANPGNEEVTFISRNEWFDHFSNVMTQQEGFTGHPYSVNNWRDTAKDLGNGDKILQHRAPLLKTMLLTSDPDFDVLSSLRYVEQEHTRYRFKFIRKITEFQNNGILREGDLPGDWVQAIIENLRLNKSAEFPFVLSGSAGGQYFIPPTPASLGVGVVTKPNITDGVIRCHDGADLPGFGDFRDAILLAFEERIYAAIPDQFKTEARPVFDLWKYVEGYWFKNPVTAYSRTEMNAILAPMFERWAQNQRLDYRSNTTFSEGDPFTWNYSTSLDRDGNALPGNYRGIYAYYFDTERPHYAPWEMLGFADKPDWFDVTYGLAPYTAGNTKLWEDLRDGRIAYGPRAGIDARYARPTLFEYLPVNDQGDLIDPMSLALVQTRPTHQEATKPWKFGDGGPVETLWRTSPSFPFALAQAGFLMKPARFVEQCWDTLNVAQDASGQWIYLPTGNRPLNSLVTVHGEFMDDGSRFFGSGIQQWISDFMRSKGQEPLVLGSAVRGLGVRLAHKVGGFTSADSTRVLADNFGLVPAEDVRIELYNSPSISEEIYSGVLIEWTGTGWRVVGYDTRTPTFTVMPGLETGPKGVISLATAAEPAINVWGPNVYYATGSRALYDGVYYESFKPHTSSAQFEIEFWKAQGSVPPQAPRVTTYLLGTGDTHTVPYGTEFTTYQEIADFLLGYERYLKQRGWQFEEIETDGYSVKDWSSATHDFLAWAQVTWEPGSFITLSPAAEGVKFIAEHGMVLDVLNPINGAYGLVDRAGFPIDRRNVVVNRIDGEATLASKNGDLYGARLHVGEIEHVLFFSNVTIFGDIIYAPLFNLRQPRLRLIGNRSTDWTGRLDAPGYVLIDGEIVSNFHKATEDLQTMFDIEKADNAVLRDHARHVIGYDSRSYFQSLVLSETEQFEFYQGMIHQKGASGAFNKLMRSDYIEQSRDLRFFEEWAVKIDEYGAMGGRSRASFLLGTSTLRNDPQMVQFRNTGDATPNADWIELIDVGANIDKKWIERPKNPAITFPQRKTFAPQPDDLPMSGYVRLNEVNKIVFNTDDVYGLYDFATNANSLPTGERIWIHQAQTYTNSAPAETTWMIVPRLANNTTNPVEGVDNFVPYEASTANYVKTLPDGQVVFRSKQCDAPFISSEEYFTVTPNTKYELRYKVRKIVKETNGSKALLRPAFDAYNDDGTPLDGFPAGEPAMQAVGAKYGFGYNPSFVAQNGGIFDIIDTTDWALNEWYTIGAIWEGDARAAKARRRLRVNRSQFDFAPYSDAVFEVIEEPLNIESRSGWDVLQVFDCSEDGEENAISSIQTTRENTAILDYITRLTLSRPHGLTDADIGKLIIVDGPTGTESEMQGVQTIMAADDNWIEVVSSNSIGVDFAGIGTIGPVVRFLRSTRFSTRAQLSIFEGKPGVKDGVIVYLDGANLNEPWRVYKRRSTRLGQPYWEPFRRQPYRVDATAISSALVYDLKTKITSESISPEPLVLNALNVISPANGIVVGRAEREIDFKLEYDPANYADNGWAKAQVGRVWWDLSKVRFLETETDYVVFGQSNEARYETEATYRSINWGKIAPATKVRIYEWTRSKLNPVEWMIAKAKDEGDNYEGTPYGFEDYVATDDEFSFQQPDVAFVSHVEYDPELGRDSVFHYYWMTGLSKKPNVEFRKLDVNAVTGIITNPLSQNLPWMSPILPNAVAVGGLSLYLDDNFDYADAEIKRSGTVFQIEVDEDPMNDGVIHDQWMLLRPNDERSLPPEWLWEKMRDSLVGFDDSLNLVPAPPEIVIGEAPVTNPPKFTKDNYQLIGDEGKQYPDEDE